MPLEYRAHIVRSDLRAFPGALWVFGDNLAQRGLGGQAKEMRGEPNAVGFPTKRLPSMQPKAFLSDADLPRVIAALETPLQRIHAQLNANQLVIIPSAGIGTGLAQLSTRAPRIALFYTNLFKRLESQYGIVSITE